MDVPLCNDSGPPPDSFVLPEHRLVYVPVAKAASAALRWMVADLAGEDFSQFYRAPGKHSSRLATINTERSAWRRAPQLGDLPDELLAEISPDRGWFVFAVVRDPWTRLWSAWQSAFLSRNQDYLTRFRRESWFPRLPERPSDIVEDWTNFVREKPWQTHPVLARDPKFVTQVSVVRPKQVGYTKIYDLAELPTLLEDIRGHLDRVGKRQELYLPNADQEPLTMAADVLSGGNAEAIGEAYGEDLAAFGATWSPSSAAGAVQAIPADAPRVIAYHAVANERIADLSRQLVAAQTQLAVERRKLRSAPAARRAAVATPRLRALARRVVNRIRSRAR